MSSRRILTADERLKRDKGIARDYTAGMATADIAARWRVGTGSVACFARAQGARQRRPGRSKREASA